MPLSVGAKLVAGILLLLVLAHRGKKAAMTSTGPVVETSHTGLDTPGLWAKSRYDAAFVEVKRRGETDDAIAHDVALSLLAHWAIETGNGAEEYNYNVGNITAYGSQAYHVMTDISGDRLRFRTFDTLADGVAAYVDLLNNSRYRGAAALLSNSPTSPAWYIALGHAGWFDPTKAKVTPRLTWADAQKLFTDKRAQLTVMVQA